MNLELTLLTFLHQVQKASVMYDPHTRESRGFGFVTMESPEEADAAITALNGTDLFGKTIAVEKVCFILSLCCCFLTVHFRLGEAVQERLLQEGTMAHPSDTIVRFTPSLSP